MAPPPPGETMVAPDSSSAASFLSPLTSLPSWPKSPFPPPPARGLAFYISQEGPGTGGLVDMQPARPWTALGWGAGKGPGAVIRPGCSCFSRDPKPTDGASLLRT